MARYHCRLGGALVLLAGQLLLISSAAAQTSEPAPDSSEAFRKFFARLTDPKVLRNDKDFADVARDLLLPDDRVWFLRNFQDEAAGALADRYERSRTGLLERLRYDLNVATGRMSAEVKAERWDKDKAGLAEGQDKVLLESLKEPLWYFKIIRVQRADGRPLPFALFFFVDGAFRYLPFDLFFPSHSPAEPRVWIGGNVQMAKLVHQVQPEHPPLARKAGVSGTVRLRAIVAKDGSVAQLEVLSGHPLLVQAALDAVQQWRYEPTLLNGEPVEIYTFIDIVFGKRR